MIIKPKDMTKKELKFAANAVECSTYLIDYCALNRFKDNCARCVFKKEDGCAIQGAPFEYKPIRDEQGGQNEQ